MLYYTSNVATDCLAESESSEEHKELEEVTASHRNVAQLTFEVRHMPEDEVKEKGTEAGIKHLQVRLRTEMYDGLRHMAVKRKMTMQQLAEQTFRDLLMHPENKAIRDLAGINEKDPDEVWRMFQTHASHNFRSAVDGIIQAWIDSGKSPPKKK